MPYIRNWFSNMNKLERPIRCSYGEFLTIENYYQAMKTTDLCIRTEISLLNPYEAKRRGRRISLRPDWDDIKLDVMEWGLRRKFQPGTKAYERLISTGKDEIVEWNNWGDCYWGAIATLSPSGQIIPVSPRRGENNLGKILMKIRDEKY